MDRLFTRSTTAKYTALNKIWDFLADPQNKGIDEKWYESFPENTIEMCVPSCWNTTLGYFRYVGTAWYRTFFETSEENIHITFEAVNNECDVYIDGKHIGHHYGGFVEFGFDAFGIGCGKHEITVRVNNTPNLKDTIPHENCDWYNYGGICRGVGVVEISNVLIRNTVIRYTLSEDMKKAGINIEAELFALKETTDTIKVYCDDKLVCQKEITVDGNGIFTLDGISLDNIRLWDIAKPNLYHITVEFGGENLTERIGFRKIETREKDVYLNGRKIKIIGVCRHEIHPDWGFSMPFELIKKDIDIIKDLNCNAVRGAHYPHSKKTIDYCDQQGLLFWEEIPLWGNLLDWNESLKEDSFVQRILTMFGEMIKRDINHPSIVFWGLYNEIDTSLPQSRALTEKMVAMVKKTDSSRLTSFATCSVHPGNPQDICSDLVDVVGFNYYTGWFPSVTEETFEQYIARMRSQVDANAKGRKMPMMMSEFGGAGIKGMCSFESQRWTENYQSLLLTKGIESYFGSEEMCGGFIWQFCNAQSQPCFELQRPGGVNNKGLVDEYRRPKAVFETVKQLYCKLNPDSDNVTEIELF